MRLFIQDKKNRDFLCLWLAQIISQFGDRINQMALIGLIAGRTPGSALELAKILSFTIIPVFIIGPIAGVYVDRWDRRTTLFVCDFLRGMLVLSIPCIFMNKTSLIPIYLVVFLAFCLSRFYVPAKMSIIPDLVETKDLLVANSLVTVTGMIAFVLGCSMGGFIVERFGSRGGFLWDATTFFISGILVFIMRPKIRLNFNRARFLETGKDMMKALRKSAFTEFMEGFNYLKNHREIRLIINMLFILFAAAGAVYVVIIVFIQETFQSVTRELGLLAVFLGVGLFLGALLYGRCGEKISRFKTIFFCLLAGGVMLIVFAAVVQNTRNFILAALLSFILGLIVGPIVIASNTIVHQVSIAEMRGKVFSSIEVVIHLAFLIAMLVSASLAEFVERYWILTAVGIIFAFVGLIGFWKTRKDLLTVVPLTNN